MRKRIHSLDGMRALAILAVFLHHSLHVKLLWMGVDLFFVLSGFLITGVLLDAKVYRLGHFFASFYQRRMRRILVPYLGFLLIASLVLGAGWMHYWYFYILLTNFLQPMRIPHPYSFDPLWSLAVEEQFYLIWPFAVYFLNTKNLKRFCIVLILLAPVLRGVLHFQQHWPIYELTPFRMDLLAAGGLLCLEWRERPERVEAWSVKLGLLLAGTGLAGLLLLGHLGYSTYGNSRVGNVSIYEACLMIAVGITLYALGEKRGGVAQQQPTPVHREDQLLHVFDSSAYSELGAASSSWSSWICRRIGTDDRLCNSFLVPSGESIIEGWEDKAATSSVELTSYQPVVKGAKSARSGWYELRERRLP